MNRDEFEAEYIRRYMKADPFREAKASMESLRVGDGYADQHIDLCWKAAKANMASGLGYISFIEW